MMPGNASDAESKFVLSLLQSCFGWTQLPITNTLLRKCGHFFEYLILGMLLFQNARFYAGSGKKKFFFCVLFALLVAIIDEKIQYYVPGRSSQALDVLIDMSGAFLGVALFFLLRGHTQKKRERRKDQA